MNEIPLTHFYAWQSVPDALVPLVMREFADNGAQNIVLTETWSTRLIREPGFYSTLRKWQKISGMNIFECHAPWGTAYDLNITDKPRRRGIIEDHRLCMEYAAEFGCKTYTVHIGPYYPGMQEPICQALEQLIPAAEKTGIVFAIENGFDPGNSPDALLYYLHSFNSPNFGCCLDTGHANVMDAQPGKKIELYAGYVKSAWNNDIRQEPNPIGKLSSFIVTTHLHDNDGYGDQHLLPGNGTISWESWIPKLRQCPRLCSFQNETSAIARCTSIKKLCQTGDSLMKL